MYIQGRNHLSVALPILLATALVSACGGGGGGSSSPTPALYEGNTGQAVVNPTNAEALATDAYVGGSVGETTAVFLAAPSKSAKRNAAYSAIDVTRKLTTISRKHLIPLADHSKISTQAVNTSTDTIIGDCGGSVVITVSGDTNTLSASGSLIFQNYCEAGLTLSGNINFDGTYNSNSGLLTNYSEDISGLIFSTPEYTIRLDGTTNWRQLSSNSDVITFDLVISDTQSANTYWLNNYKVTTTFEPGTISQTIFGRYYDPTHGYLDFQTVQPLVTLTGDSWPAIGSILYSGRLGSEISLSFSLALVTVSADFDGDGSDDWKSEFTNPGTDKPPVNLPPIADAGPDQTVYMGDVVTLNGNGSSDPEGNTLFFTWRNESCPIGGCALIENYQSVSPSFRPKRVGTYIIELVVYDGTQASASDFVTITVNPIPESNPSLLGLDWNHAFIERDIGKKGLQASDLDGDGSLEIIGTSSSSTWYVLRKTDTLDYEQSWSSTPNFAPISRLAVATPSGASLPSIYVADESGALKRYNGTTFAIEAETQFPDLIYDIELVDIDRDGSTELVATDSAVIYVLDAITLAEKSRLAGYAGRNIAIGNVDADQSLELVLDGGYVVDWDTQSLQWHYPQGFRSYLDTGDVDGDGIEEIVAVGDWYHIYVYDADTESIGFHQGTANNDSLALADVSGDGVPDIIYGDSSSATIRAIDVTTQIELWQITKPYTATSLVVEDMDKNGTIDVLWGTIGNEQSVPSRLMMAEVGTGSLVWSSTPVTWASVLAYGDLNNNGNDEVVLVSHPRETNPTRSVLGIAHTTTNQIEWLGELPADMLRPTGARIADVDSDGQAELVVTGYNTTGGIIYVFDGATRMLEGMTTPELAFQYSSFDIADIDKDGQLEIIAGQVRTSSEAEGTHLIVFDAKTLNEEWRTDALTIGAAPMIGVTVDDIDGDSNSEIMFTLEVFEPLASYTEYFFIIDPATHLPTWQYPVASHAFEVADIDSDGGKELVIAQLDGSVVIFSANDLTMENSLQLPLHGPIRLIKSMDVDLDGSPEWVVSADGYLQVFQQNSNSLVWQSEYLGWDLSGPQQVILSDMDGDSLTEMVLGAGGQFYEFDASSSP